MNKKSKISIVGSGFSSLASACYLAKAGYTVDVFEKNDTLGGRARVYEKDGFKFDIGPTWYWMPDVFEKFFADFDKSPSDYYDLEKLSPGYEVYFGKGDSLVISDNIDEIYKTFENEEQGSSIHLDEFLSSAKKNYSLAIDGLVYRPGVSPLELITKDTILNVTEFFGSISQRIRKKIKSSKLIQILEFPVLFLGAKPSNTPGFYNFMNHADFGLGTWHPKGGMYEVIKACVSLAEELGVNFHTNAPVQKIEVNNGHVSGIRVNDVLIQSDIVLSGADYVHSESLLSQQYRAYSDSYWKKRVFAPSALLFFVGFDKEIEHVHHHTLFFDSDFDIHAYDIYDSPNWPDDPLFYASFPSKTDDSFAPEGYEAVTFLIPLATDLEDTDEIREAYFEKIITRLEQLTNQEVKQHVLFKKSYCINDFKEDYNSYGGNAYGLANTLTQTAFLRPKLKSKKVDNLYFTGQLTVPGPGVPPSLISGKVVAELITKNNKL